MRRVLVLAAAFAAWGHGISDADPWAVTAEAGGELDSNVQRVETGTSTEDEPVTAGVMRFGARLERKGKAVGGPFTFNLSDLTRIVADRDVTVENVTALAAGLRWMHALQDRPVGLGFAVSGIDVLPLSDTIGNRTYRALAADGLLAMRSQDEHELTLGLGVRDFSYKPDHDLDYRGPAANARLELMLWQPASQTKSLELVTTVGFENRTFNVLALANACPPSGPPPGTDPKECFADTQVERRDRYQRLGVELTWIGRQVAALGYQITVIDSNNYGESLARHRITASGTAVLPHDIYGTLLVILQIDQYLDGRILSQGPQMQEYTSIDDENRSSLQLRLAHVIGGSWSIEARAAIWRNIAAADSMAVDFKRELVYLGLVYGK